jgi:hypothetical protein
MNHARMRVALAVATIAALAFAATALAVQTPFDDIDLEADGGDATFEYGLDYGCTDGTSSSSGDEFYSVEDGSTPDGSDAFDGALVLYVGDSPFTVPTETADQTGEQIRSDTLSLRGLKVQRVGTALPDSPTLRELIKFKNPKKKTVKTRVALDTEYGSDDEITVRATSSGDRNFNRQDRWGITSDGPADPPGDSVVTLVNYGKGKVLKPDQQIGPFSANEAASIVGADCTLDTFPLKLRKKQTGYLMFFLEIADTNADAISNTSKFNAKKLNGDLKAGLSKGVQKKILNWDLGKKKGKRK